MWRSSALCLAALLGVGGCSNEIVLGHRLAALPSAPDGSGGTAAGFAGNGAAGKVKNGNAGSSAAAGTDPSRPDGPIPPPSDVVWSTDHEVGDWSDWERGGSFYGGQYAWGQVNAYVDIGVGCAGGSGLVADINTNSPNETSAGVHM